jgi:hypothetical protein
LLGSVSLVGGASVDVAGAALGTEKGTGSVPAGDLLLVGGSGSRGGAVVVRGASPSGSVSIDGGSGVLVNGGDILVSAGLSRSFYGGRLMLLGGAIIPDFVSSFSNSSLVRVIPLAVWLSALPSPKKEDHRSNHF